MTLHYIYDKATSKWREYDGKLKKFGADAPPSMQKALSLSSPGDMDHRGGVDIGQSVNERFGDMKAKAMPQTKVENVRVKPGNRKNPNPTIVTFQGRNYGFDVTFKGGGRWREIGADGYFGKTARSDINHRLSQMYFPQYNLIPGQPLQIPKTPRKVIQGLPMFQKSKGGALPSKDIPGKLNITGGSDGVGQPLAHYTRPSVILPPPSKGTPGMLNIRAPEAIKSPFPEGPDNGTNPAIKLPLPFDPNNLGNIPSPNTQKRVDNARGSFGLKSITNLFRGRQNPGNGGVNGGPTAPSSVNGGAPRSSVKRQNSAGGKVGGSEILGRIASNTEYTNVILTAILRYFRKDDTEKSIDREFRRAREIEGKTGDKHTRLSRKGKRSLNSKGDLVAGGLGTLLGVGALAALVWEMMSGPLKAKIVESIDKWGKELVTSFVHPELPKTPQDAQKRENAVGAPPTRDPKESAADFTRRKEQYDNNVADYRKTLPNGDSDAIPEWKKKARDLMGGDNDGKIDLSSAINYPISRDIKDLKPAHAWNPLHPTKEGPEINTDLQKMISKMSAKPAAAKSYTPDIKTKDDGTVDSDDILRYIKSKGYSDKIARAIMGNFAHESGGLRPDAKGDNGSAFGLGQWRGPRLEALKKFAALRGTSIEDPKTQLDFAMQERQFGRVLQKMRRWEAGGSDQDTLTKVFGEDYERPAKDKSGNILGLTQRQSAARNLAPVSRNEGAAIEDKKNQVAAADADINTTIVAPVTTNITNNYMGKNGGGQIASPRNDETSWDRSQDISAVR